jgi:hypothetical protein
VSDQKVQKYIRKKDSKEVRWRNAKRERRKKLMEGGRVKEFLIYVRPEGNEISSTGEKKLFTEMDI